MHHRMLPILCLALAACGSTERDDVVGSPPDGGDPGATGGGDGGTGPADDGGDGVKFDTPDGSGGPGDDGDQEGCEKVDFLFVIDNSGSMANDQMNLINSFPGFISHIENTLQARDFHIMVIDVDEWIGSVGTIGCSPDPPCCMQNCRPGMMCNGTMCPTPAPPTPCDEELGAGRTTDIDGNPCPITGGNRYLIDGQADLGGTFGCLARVGTWGDGNERPMEAMMRAVGPETNAPGACNAGFVRDDAILVVTFITDEEDKAGKSMGDPAMWKQALVDAKKGNEEAIVVLGLAGDPTGMYCSEGEDAQRLYDFVQSFGPRGTFGAVCEPDYSPFFIDAVDLIDITCDEFVPPQG